MIKIKQSELTKKSTKELLWMRKQMESHLLKAYAPKNIKTKGFNINEEKKNIARINTILRDREDGE